MDYTFTATQLFAAASLAFLLSGLFCGYLRWAHLCRPYHEAVDKYDPGRSWMTIFYVGQVLQFPYILDPGNPGAWL